MNTKKPPLPIFIFLFCLGILCSFPMQGQQRDTQKEYNVDSTLYAYYMRCKAEVSSPIVMQMSDTLFLMAEEQGDQRMQAVALCNKLDYYYYKNNQPDSINHYVEIVKDFAKKTNQPKCCLAHCRHWQCHPCTVPVPLPASSCWLHIVLCCFDVA